DHLPKSEQTGLGVGIKTHGVFLVKKITQNPTCFSPYSIKSDAYFSLSPKLTIDDKENKAYETIEIVGFNKKFNSVEDFDVYLKNMNLSPLIENDESIKKKDAEFLEKSKFNKNQYSKRVENAKNYQKRITERIEKSKNVIQSKASENITFEIVNEEVTGSGTQYYEFDI